MSFPATVDITRQQVALSAVPGLDSSAWPADLLAKAFQLMGWFNIAVSDSEPMDTRRIWYRLSSPGSGLPGTSYRFDPVADAWVQMTPTEFVAYLSYSQKANIFVQSTAPTADQNPQVMDWWLCDIDNRPSIYLPLVNGKLSWLNVSGAAIDASAIVAAVKAAVAAGTLNLSGGGGGVSITAGDVNSALALANMHVVESFSVLPSTGNTEGRLVNLNGVLYIYQSGAWVKLFDQLTAAAPPGIDVFSTNPSVGNYEGRVIYNSSTQMLMQYVGGAWIQVVSPTGATATVADGSITTAKFAAGIKPVAIVSSLPSSGDYDGQVVLNTTDNKIYSWDVPTTSWKTGVAAGDISGTLVSSQFGAGSVTSTALAANAVIAGKISAGAISATEIASGAITTDKIAAGAITTPLITASAVTADQIASNAITSGKIAANAITAGAIQAGAIGTSQLAAGAVTADKIAANSITSTQIQAGAINASVLAAGSITSSLIQSAAITSDKLSSGVVDGTTITGATVRTGSGSSRVEMAGSSNDLKVYVSGTAVAQFGGTVANGLLEIDGTSSTYYPAYFSNSSSSGGAVKIVSTGGYTLECSQTSSTSGYYGAVIRNTTGGFGAIGGSSGSGGKAFTAISGGYAPFTGCHDGFILKTDAPAVGDILVDGDIINVEIMDTITKVATTTTVNNPAAIGIYVQRYPMDDNDVPPAMTQADLKTPIAAWGPLKPDYDIAVINSIGEGGINVCGLGGNITKGDLIVTSTMAGKGQKQADNIIYNYTVARARESQTFTNPTDVAMIACVYLCG